MAGPLYYDRVQETTSTTGTGTYTLSGATTGYQAFSVVGNGNTCYYAITDGTNWEVGLGTYTLSGTTLARTSIVASSNSNAAVSWGAGAKNIWLDAPATAFTKFFGSALLSSFVGLVNSAGALTNDGSGNLSWAVAGLVLLTSGTVASAATCPLVLSSYTAYRGFRIIISGFQPATDGVDLYMRFSTNGGSSYDNTTYSYSGQRIDTGGTSGAFNSSSAAQISLVGGANASNGANAQIISTIELQNPFATTLFSSITHQTVSYGNNGSRPNYSITGQGSHGVAQKTNAVQLLFSSGNIAAGNYAVYGYN